MKKKVSFVLILVLFLGFVYADQTAKNVPMEKIDKAVEAKIPENSMEKCNDRDLAHFIGLNHSDLDGYIYYKGTQALSVDEVLIVKTKNKEQKNQVKDAVEKRIKSEKKTFEGYGPEQVSLLRNAIVKTKGNYVFFSVGKNSDKIEEAFKDVI